MVDVHVIGGGEGLGQHSPGHKQVYTALWLVGQTREVVGDKGSPLSFPQGHWLLLMCTIYYCPYSLGFPQVDPSSAE